MIIRRYAVWLSTEEAVDWVRLNNPDGEVLLKRVDPHGVSLSVRAGVVEASFGINSADLVKLGRYLLAVADAQGQNLNPGMVMK